MASASCNPCQWKYDVFISFRGADTRDGFVSHLFDSFRRNHIITFLDENLDRGEEISRALLQTIEGSCVSVVIFSENYAYSPWCLDELVKIFQCRDGMGQVVLPVFYQIDPTDVQELTGSYRDAFIKHRDEFKDDLDKVESWSHAVNEIARLSGSVSKKLLPESKLVEMIVSQVLEIVDQAVSNGPCDDGLFGIEKHIKHVESLLHFESEEVRFLGIWGMGGIGKTTLARKIYDCFSSKFESRCIIENVREKSEKRTFDSLQHEILSKVLGRELTNVDTIMLSSSIRKRILRKKVILVLDDVNDVEQVEFLIGNSSIYAAGSRIIITIRNKQILRNGVAEIYEVKQLDHYEALQLFLLHAFKQNHPTVSYIALVNKAVNYAQDIPLATKVLGSNLYSKSVKEWESELEKLEAISDKKIEKILRWSCDELDENEKEIFLDIACFFDLEDEDHVASVLDSCGLFARAGIRSLLDKSLITVSRKKVVMHDLIRKMAHGIVCKQSVRSPGERSRLWIPREIYHVLKKDKGTSSVEGISLNVTIIKHIELSSTAFVKMRKLRFLDCYSPYYPKGIFYDWYSDNILYDPNNEKVNVYLPKAGLSFLPDELRYLYWYKYPAKSLPLNFCHDNLVQLHLIHSHIKELFFEDQCLEKLKVMDLSYSVNLIKIPDLSDLPKIEVLCLTGCLSLVEICSSIKHHRKLYHLNLGNCKSLGSFPKFIDLRNLDFLCLEGCSKITEFPEVPASVRQIILNGTAIQEIPTSIGYRSLITKLELEFCTTLKSLPNCISELTCLEKLSLRGCSELMILPDGICNLKSLKFLSVVCCLNLNGLPENLGNLKSLERLLKNLPFSINSLSNLDALGCDGCKGLTLPSFTAGLSRLRWLSLGHCGLHEISSSIGSLVSLQHMHLDGNNFVKLPTSIKDLPRIIELDLSNCSRLKTLPDIPLALQYLRLRGCVSLKSMPVSFTEANLENLWWLDVRNCINLGQKKSRNMMFDMIQRLQNASKLTPKRTFPETESSQYIVYTFLLGFCISGNELPDMLSYKNYSGSSVQFSERSYSHNFLVLAFSAVIASVGNNSPDRPRVNCSFAAESGDTLTFVSECPSYLPSSDVSDENLCLEQTYFWVSSVEIFNCNYSFDEATFEFYTSCERSSDIVIRCGVYLFCKDNDINLLLFEDTARYSDSSWFRWHSSISKFFVNVN